MTEVERLARELGKAVQADERYIAYLNCKKANDEDKELQNLIGRLNLIQMNYQQEAAKADSDENKLKLYNEDFENVYGEIMTNQSMKKFEEAKQDVDDMMNYVVKLLSMVTNGADPEIAQPDMTPETGCTGDCGSCGGCG
jgi:cell fate (sporulation/competence/biofilm development) regulator YlbF (YheA/YmcA/DUF963 family)